MISKIQKIPFCEQLKLRFCTVALCVFMLIGTANSSLAQVLTTAFSNSSSAPLLSESEYVFKPSQFDLPIVLNQKVKAVIRYYTRAKRNGLIQGYKRSGKYLPMIRRILHSEGLPKELAYIVVIESNFNERSRSHKDAIGLWQFMTPTAHQYNLKINEWIDERKDPTKSTKAAAKHLKYLYRKFRNWELAMAAYNAGEGRIQRAISEAKKKKKPTDFWSLRLPKETQNYVPAVMGIAIIYNDVKKYGLQQISRAPQMDETQISIPVDFSLREVARRAGISFQKLLDYNPALYRGAPPIDESSYALYIPKANYATLWQSLQRLPTPSSHWKQQYSALLEDTPINLQTLERYGDIKWFRVKLGENLATIARKYDTTVRRIRRWNRVPSNGLLRIHQRLKIYIPNWKVAEYLRDHSQKNPKGNQILVKVPKGMTLSELALRYNVTVYELMNWNSLRSPFDLRANQKLVIYTRPQIIRVPYGTTLSHLAQRYKTTVQKLMAWNNLSHSSELRAQQKLIVAQPYSQPKLKTHTKREKIITVPTGATLSELALKYDVTVKELMQWNQLQNSLLRTNQRLIVSKPNRGLSIDIRQHRVIQVKGGDTLWTIAKKYQTSVRNLLALNSLKSEDRLQQDQKLIVPIR